MVLNYGINNHLPLDCLNFPKAIYKCCRRRFNHKIRWRFQSKFKKATHKNDKKNDLSKKIQNYNR